MLRSLTRALTNDTRPNFKLSSEYVKGPERVPGNKVRTFKESFDDMKAKFGPDYQTPFDKYDLHVPKVQVQEDNRSNYERYHERHNYAQSKKTLAFIGLSLLAGCLIFARNFNKWKKNKADLAEALQIYSEHDKKSTEAAALVLKIRRNQIEELKRKHNQAR